MTREWNFHLRWMSLMVLVSYNWGARTWTSGVLHWLCDLQTLQCFCFISKPHHGHGSCVLTIAVSNCSPWSTTRAFDHSMKAPLTPDIQLAAKHTKPQRLFPPLTQIVGDSVIRNVFSQCSCLWYSYQAPWSNTNNPIFQHQSHSSCRNKWYFTLTVWIDQIFD